MYRFFPEISAETKENAGKSSFFEEMNKEIVEAKRKCVEANRECVEANKGVKDLLQDIYNELEEHIHNCKISNTVGNSVGIVSAGLLFTPLWMVGIVGIISGAGTSLGTAAVRQVITSNKYDRVKDLLKIKHDAYLKYGEAIKGCISTLAGASSASFTTLTMLNGVRTAAEVGDVLKTFSTIRQLQPAATVTYNGASGAAEIAQLGAKALNISKVVASVGVAINVLDIILTWTIDDRTLLEIKKEIDKANDEINELLSHFPGG